MKRDRTKDLFIEQTRKLPIIQVVCEKIGIARSTLYRWRDEDEEFRKDLEDALNEGEGLINDMSESQLISLIKDRNYPAISFWLRHRNPKFRERLEVNATVKSQEQLTPEQESTVRQALQLAELVPEHQPKPKQPSNQSDKKTNGQDKQPIDSAQ